MKAKRNTRKKKSGRLKKRSQPAAQPDLEPETDPDSALFDIDNNLENDIVDIDELEDFTLNPEELDDSEW